MILKPSEIDKVETIGEMDGEPVEMIRTLGGLFVAVGKPKGKKQKEVLAAASHGAIAKYNVEKNFREFRPSLQKSERFEPETIGLTELLPKKLIEAGHDLYLIKNESSLDFVLTKNSLEVNKIVGTFSDDSLVLQRPQKNIDVRVAHSIGKASAREAISNNKEFVVVDKKRFLAKEMV
jgi:hypothetical protein